MVELIDIMSCDVCGVLYNKSEVQQKEMEYDNGTRYYCPVCKSENAEYK